ncbi:MAG TPA: reverse transcriptase domain-containing protein, partial [Acidimicrobiales bacterium]|nr:reverse transcriptase domain-containing protein [Acidimicrobiales bacterium]
MKSSGGKRESDGVVVLGREVHTSRTPRKGPDFGHAGNEGTSEGMDGTARPISPLGPPSQDKVRRLQNRLWAAAKQSEGRRFHALYDRIYRDDTLWEAWERVRANRGAAGVDRLTIAVVEDDYGVERLLTEIRGALCAGNYRPAPVRRVEIPKPDGRMRPLGIPTVRDRVVQQAAKLILEPIFEADFLPCSFGFRPKRSATDAAEAIRVSFPKGKHFVFEADITNFLEASTHCPLHLLRPVEEAGLGPFHLDSQAFSPPRAHMDSLELAALYTLQHRLAADAERLGGFEHGQPAGRGLFDEAGTKVVGDADAPRCAGSELLAGDKAVSQPAVHGGRCDSEDLRRFGDRDELAFSFVGARVAAGDLPRGAQAGDATAGEALAGGGAPSLAVQDAGDRRVVVVDSEPPHERNGVLVGADRWRVR